MVVIEMKRILEMVGVCEDYGRQQGAKQENRRFVGNSNNAHLDFNASRKGDNDAPLIFSRLMDLTNVLILGYIMT